MIYTLEYLKKEAKGIAGSWNGEDNRFIDHTGESRTGDDADVANELLDKIKEVEALIEELSI